MKYTKRRLIGLKTPNLYLPIINQRLEREPRNDWKSLFSIYKIAYVLSVLKFSFQNARKRDFLTFSLTCCTHFLVERWPCVRSYVAAAAAEDAANAMTTFGGAGVSSD